MVAQLIEEFDTWQQGYAGVTVKVRVGDTATLASLFLDEGLSVPATNPQVLLSQTDAAGRTYGKFLASLYVDGPYSLEIVGQHTTGIHQAPLSVLDGIDARLAMVGLPGSLVTQRLQRWFKQIIYAEAFGTLGTSAAENTSIITQAMGAAGTSGGLVILPAGTFPLNQLTIPTGVTLCGQGSSATILESSIADKVIILGGRRASLKRLTVDGLNLVAGGIGVYSDFQRYILIDDVLVKRFDTGLMFEGGIAHWYQSLSADNCNTGISLKSQVGKRYEVMAWLNGEITACTNRGLELQGNDTVCGRSHFLGISFRNNLTNALRIEGARDITFDSCEWRTAQRLIFISDFGDAQTIGVRVNGGILIGGAVRLDNTAQDVGFRGAELRDLTWDLNQINAVKLEDCLELGSSTILANEEMLRRERSQNRGRSLKITTTATPTTVWLEPMVPGQAMVARAMVVGRALNSLERWAYIINGSIRRQGSDLGYINKSGTFTLGDIVTGSTSAASGRIVQDAASALRLIQISGSFIDGEIIIGATGGQATTNGVLQPQAVAVGLQAKELEHESDAAVDAVFSATATAVTIEVTGKAGVTIEWQVDVHQAAST